MTRINRIHPYYLGIVVCLTAPLGIGCSSAPGGDEFSSSNDAVKMCEVPTPDADKKSPPKYVPCKGQDEETKKKEEAKKAEEQKKGEETKKPDPPKDEPKNPEETKKPEPPKDPETTPDEPKKGDGCDDPPPPPQPCPPCEKK